jgi:hypothetical protein
VVDLAGREPAIGHGQGAAVPASLVGQLRPDQTHRGIRHRAPQCPAPHALFHRGQIEVLDHDLAVGARQLGAELMSCFPP